MATRLSGRVAGGRRRGRARGRDVEGCRGQIAMRRPEEARAQASARAAPRRVRAPRGCACPTLEQRQLDLIGLGAGRPRRLLRASSSTSAGTAAAPARRRRGPALAARRRPLPRAGRAGGGGRDPGAAPVLPAVRPFRSGAICLFAALDARRSPRARSASARAARAATAWDPAWVKTRGGIVGEALDWVATTLLGTRRRPHPRALPVLAGVLLLTGASVAGVIKATGDSVVHDRRASCARDARRGHAPPRRRARS